MISPTRFHNSVHNAAAGYWSIATRSKAASNSLCGFDVSFAAGLLEAVTQVVVDQTRVLLVAYDAQYPPPLFVKRPIPEAFGVAFVLAPVTTSSRAAAHMAVAPHAESRRAASGAATELGEAAAPPASAAAHGSTGNHTPQASGGSLGRLTVRLADARPDRMSNTDLEGLRASVPAARSLPLLRQLAVREPGVVNIEYLDGRSLAVEVDPCA
jgi:hypothetical protein